MATSTFGMVFKTLLSPFLPLFSSSAEVTNTKLYLLFKTDMFTDHRNGVVNVLPYCFNKVMMDRHNCKRQDIKTSGRGFRSFQNFRSAILLSYRGINFIH